MIRGKIRPGTWVCRERREVHLLFLGPCELCLKVSDLCCHGRVRREALACPEEGPDRALQECSAGSIRGPRFQLRGTAQQGKGQREEEGAVQSSQG